MSKENPMDKALRELQKVIGLIEKNKAQLMKGEFTPDVRDEFLALQAQVAAFSKQSEKELRELGVPEEALRMAVEEGEAEEGTADEKEALKRAYELKQQLQQMREEFGETLEKGEEKPKKPKEEKSKHLKGKRRRKFREMGDDRWKPL